MFILDKMKLRNQIEMWQIFLPHFGCGSLGVHWKIGLVANCLPKTNSLPKSVLTQGCSLKVLSSQKVNLFHGFCLRIFTAGSVSESGCGAGNAGVPSGLAGAAVDQRILEREPLWPSTSE